MSAKDASSSAKTKAKAAVPPSPSPPPPSRGPSMAALLGLSLLVAGLSTGLSLTLQAAMKGELPALAVSVHRAASELLGLDQGSAMVQDAGSMPAAGVWWTDAESYRQGYVCRHGYTVSVLKRDPLIFFIENFLQPGEGDYFRNVSAPKMKRSSVAESADNYFAESRVRTSSSAFLKKNQDPVVACVEQRGSMLSGVPLEDCEPLQVVWYTKGQEYKPHFDYFPRKDLTDYWSQRSGQRYVTILPYINDDMKGGATGFPKLGLEVQPKKDAAVMWFNVGPDEVEDNRTLHGGMPVEEGEKWAINIWQRKKIPGWDSGVSAPGADDHGH